ncbi:hypothetical protein [Cupriavidus malaysiensis]|uniref:Uncharacterized protein n=1 Tax=Cupriavidus malaysiensis TaxID=367825 RepID=A0ABN4TX54_9BURK|nr:hypothetical protein [Cupriavidus malaysiensis]AOZ11154.1 hypothetical protein BKK80_34945 [Cupriavidus malaysiensis]
MSNLIKRAKLGRHLLEAWVRAVEKDYCSGHINSERSLQALLVANLHEVFREARVKRRIFVEPTILLRDRKLIRPNIVICNTREASGFLELKYTPRGKASTAKDMQSISSIARDEQVSIDLQRYQGPELPPMTLRMSKMTLFGGLVFTLTLPRPLWTGRPPTRLRLTAFSNCTQGRLPAAYPRCTTIPTRSDSLEDSAMEVKTDPGDWKEESTYG